MDGEAGEQQGAGGAASGHGRRGKPCTPGQRGKSCKPSLSCRPVFPGDGKENGTRGRFALSASRASFANWCWGRGGSRAYGDTSCGSDGERVCGCRRRERTWSISRARLCPSPRPSPGSSWDWDECPDSSCSRNPRTARSGSATAAAPVSALPAAQPSRGNGASRAADKRTGRDSGTADGRSMGPS